MSYKIGIGYDIHRLVAGRKLILGGVEIPYIKGLLGHSDADVLLHAICDALLGGASQNDIGELFPNTDPQYLNCPSIDLLKAVARLIQKNGFSVVNIDAVIIAEEPKITPFKKQIRESIAAALGIDSACVGLKGKTNEGHDSIGRNEAIACHAVVLLAKKE